MKVEIIVKVDGDVVREQVESVAGTLEQMEEAIDAMGREAMREALQASVHAMTPPRPLFLPKGENTGTRATGHGRSSG